MSDGIQGQFVWHELITTDTKSAAGFYSKVARLKTQAAPSDSTSAVFVASGQPILQARGLLSAADPRRGSRARAPYEWNQQLAVSTDSLTVKR